MGGGGWGKGMKYTSLVYDFQKVQIQWPEEDRTSYIINLILLQEFQIPKWFPAMFVTKYNRHNIDKYATAKYSMWRYKGNIGSTQGSILQLRCYDNGTRNYC